MFDRRYRFVGALARPDVHARPTPIAGETHRSWARKIGPLPSDRTDNAPWMALSVTCSDDPGAVLATAGEFLASRPVDHNVILTLLHTRAAHPIPGRYWIAAEDDQVIGVLLQSPTDFPATLTPMPAPAIGAVVAAVIAAGADLPGVSGDAATAARFAGQWTEHHRSGAVPVDGQRIYEVGEVVPPSGVRGRARLTEAADRDTLVRWLRACHDELGERGGDDAELAVDRRLPAGHFWVLDAGGDVVSMAARTDAVAGVARVQAVFTPPEHRKRGYAAACVAALSACVLDEGHRCILYTDLGNATSNGVYRSIGYRSVAEWVRYRFT